MISKNVFKFHMNIFFNPLLESFISIGFIQIVYYFALFKQKQKKTSLKIKKNSERNIKYKNNRWLCFFLNILKLKYAISDVPKKLITARRDIYSVIIFYIQMNRRTWGVYQLNYMSIQCFEVQS